VNRFPFDEDAYRPRNVVERTFCRLKDFRAVATRYDKLARNFLAGVCIVAALCFWAK
jgi:putative transposase